jgi:hypothetical protein
MRAVFPILAALMLMSTCIPATAAPFWQKPKAQPQQAAPSNSLMGPPQALAPKPRLNGPGPHKGDWLRKYGSLPPAEQEQKLESDPVFRSLTPDNQRRLIDRLHFFNSLSPAKKQQVLNRMEVYEHLTPAQQGQFDNLSRQFHSLPNDQQTQVQQAYKELRKMTPEQRAEYFNSDEFRNGMNDGQKNILRGMSELYPNASK